MTIANLEEAVTAAPADSRQMRNAIIASVLGWSLDLFEHHNSLFAGACRSRSGRCGIGQPLGFRSPYNNVLDSP